jgi:DNA-directed RNA polymerase specialized sigma54-like protein
MNTLSGWYDGAMPHPSYNKCQGRCGLQLLKDLRDAVSDINKKNSDRSFQFESTESRIYQFVDVIIDKDIARYEVSTNMLDSISTNDIDNIVGQFTSNIMETYIDEAEMTDLDESI